MNLIKFKNVHKSFGERKIMDQMNLEVEKGETLTIIGGSGTGKSVTLKMVLGLVEPDLGEVFFDGKNIHEIKEDQLREVRRKIGMVFQGSALFDSLTVEENIAYPIYEHFNYSDSKVKKIVKEKLDLVGLPGIEDVYPEHLSGGMKKRVGLARAIAADPEVILYDEPTAGLDPANKNRINELIVNFRDQLKVTSIVVTHEMDSAYMVSNRVALLYNKKIEFVGSVDEVRNSKNDIVERFIKGQIGETK
jgi:phospholipid/cholesterol/gamma-HCH transport system ATP-binding protein